ncbi:unnamed protein product [Linum trigynum]|uniref:Uncharacterized protein n=1 Tax=Linum trigynum TaxID=586398 RepID=A0AAV2GSP4_9ROSI
MHSHSSSKPGTTVQTPSNRFSRRIKPHFYAPQQGHRTCRNWEENTEKQEAEPNGHKRDILLYKEKHG